MIRDKLTCLTGDRPVQQKTLQINLAHVKKASGSSQNIYCQDSLFQKLQEAELRNQELSDSISSGNTTFTGVPQ